MYNDGTRRLREKEQETGQTLLVGCCGGIAAYKVAEIVRIFQRNRWTVRVIGTPSARNFVGGVTWEGLTGFPYIDDVQAAGHAMEHIHGPDRAAAYVVAPATAKTLAALAHGYAVDMVSASYLAAQCPVIVAPAMNTAMWAHPATRRNLRLLQKDGVHVVPTDQGDLACGWQGDGRLADPAAIYWHVQKALRRQSWSGKTVMVSAGGSREYFDPVRFLSNPSTGKMGLALALAAWLKGADVHLLAFPSAMQALEQQAGLRQVSRSWAITEVNTDFQISS